MPQSPNLATYTDIKQQLTAARAMGGAKMQFSTFAKACVWMARAYKFRAILRKNLVERSNVPGYAPTTPWDDLILRHDKRAQSTFVTVEFGAALSGKLLPLDDGLRVAVPSENTEGLAMLPSDPLDDDLLADARKLLGT